MSSIFKYILLSILVVCLSSGFSVFSQRMEVDVWATALDPEKLEAVRLFEGRTGKIVITETIDLEGREGLLSEGLTLIFKKGGRITNGRLVGNNTKIEYSGSVFDRVRIAGTWNVPKIKTSMFADLNYDNSLKDVMALSNSEVKNVIVIEKGDYYVTAKKNEDICLPVISNTTLTIHGTIRLKPNDFRNYYILQATGENITINGSGTIIGDKLFHTGKDGEWGMGINLKNACNAQVKGLTIKDCWGDCIYVGDKSTKITISKCKLDNGRRQGISITSANGVLVKECQITNIAGTNPEYAIDVEPNRGDTVRNIVVVKVSAEGCKGGFLVWGKAIDAFVDNVVFKNLTVGVTTKCPISLESSNNITVKNCTVVATGLRIFLSCKNITNATIKRNEFIIKPALKSKLIKAISRNASTPDQTIVQDNCSNITIEGNDVLEGR